MIFFSIIPFFENEWSSEKREMKKIINLTIPVTTTKFNSVIFYLNIKI